MEKQLFKVLDWPEVTNIFEEVQNDLTVTEPEQNVCLHCVLWQKDVPLHVISPLITSQTIHKTCAKGQEPLECYVTKKEINWDVVYLLIKHGALETKDKSAVHRTLLYALQHHGDTLPLDIATQLISRSQDEDINTPNPTTGMTTLHRVCDLSRWDLVPLLVSRGADVDAIFERTYETPLHIAVDNNAPVNIVTKLISSENLNMSNIQKGTSTPFRIAHREENWEVLTKLVQYGAHIAHDLETLMQWCVWSIRNHMPDKSDEAFEKLQLPPPLLSMVKMEDWADDFIEIAKEHDPYDSM